jgi:DNA-binding MarR family transcriptional regulator
MLRADPSIAARGHAITAVRPATASPATDPPWLRGLHTDTGYLLYRLGLRAGQLFNAHLQEWGLRLRHYALVRYLATVDGAQQRELSDRLGYDPSAIVGLVDELVRHGFVERRAIPGDRRSRLVVLTDAGRELLRSTDHAGHQVSDELLGPLTADERAQVHALLLRAADAEAQSAEG